jgi:hypothetical protein
LGQRGHSSIFPSHDGGVDLDEPGEADPRPRAERYQTHDIAVSFGEQHVLASIGEDGSEAARERLPFDPCVAELA